MRLTELDPHWTSTRTVVTDDNGVIHNDWGQRREGMGLSFMCPHCRTQRLAIFFANPIDGGQPAQDLSGYVPGAYLYANLEKLWTRSGDSFENLSLTPSIDVSKSGHWHGFITNGEIE